MEPAQQNPLQETMFNSPPISNHTFSPMAIIKMLLDVQRVKDNVIPVMRVETSNGHGRLEFYAILRPSQEVTS